MPRIQGLEEVFMTANGLVKGVQGQNTPGEVHSITIAFNGVTAGQSCFLRDGTDGAAEIKVMFTFEAANGTITKEWPQGKRFDHGIFWDAGPGDAGDRVFAEITYK